MKPLLILLMTGWCLGLNAQDTTEVFKGTFASFPGGDSAMHQWIRENVEYPEEALDMGEEGTVYVSFIVEADGSIDSVWIFKGVCRSLDKEAMRLVRAMPTWIPAETENGTKGKMLSRIPIKFTIVPNERKKKGKKRRKQK